jgi:hypothetical protein
MDRIRRALRTDQTFDPRQVWMLYNSIELSIVARTLLSICASEAAVERSFSTQKFVHSTQRNRLKADAVEAEMMICFNTNTLESRSMRLRVTMNILEDCMGTWKKKRTACNDPLRSCKRYCRKRYVPTDEEGDEDEDSDEEQLPPLVAAAAGTRQSRRIQRVPSVKFKTESDFVKWFATDIGVWANTTWNVDLRNLLQGSARRLVSSPCTERLEELVKEYAQSLGNAPI